jgi:S-DNA-T family DNA segregation ATPase FtsK/SpoIIIE
MAKKTTSAKGAADVAGQWQLAGYLLWILMAGAWVMLTLSLVSYDPADPPSLSVAPLNDVPTNWVGWFGAFIAHKSYLMVGPGVWIVVTAGLVLLIALIRKRPPSQLLIRAIGAVLMAIVVSAIIGMMGPDLFHRAEGSGGLVAYYINHELTTRFNTPGTMVILVIAFWVAALLAVDEWVLALPRWIGQVAGMVPRVQMPRPQLVGALPSFGNLHLKERLFGRPAGDNDAASATAVAEPPSKKRGKRNEVEEPIDEDAGGFAGTESFDPDAARATGKKRGKVESQVVLADDVDEDDAEVEGEIEYEEVDEADADDEEQIEADAEEADAAIAYIKSKEDFDPEQLREKIKKLPINFASRAQQSVDLPPREPDLSGYRFPTLDILAEAESGFDEEIRKYVQEQAVILESALQEYRIEGNVVAIDTGPVITLYEVRLAPGTKVNRLQSIASDLARSLRAQNIRIVPNIIGKGIEVPNQQKEKVRLKELMTTDVEGVQKMKLPMFLGKDASGNALIQDLASMPHMLIAGTTGSGKSVCMNSIIMSFLYTKRPDELKLVLVDPKMVEMSMFKDIPHLMCPVVTEMGKAAAILEWATTKMDERYELLAEVGVRDIASYNSLGWDEIKERMQPTSEAEEARIPKKLPYMVFVIDELADLMHTNKEVEGFIVRIAQKARAVGIHLILATQRPQANVVTGLIKGNMPCRVSFKVASRLDSRIVLDQSGAELLLGQGDMLFLSPRTSKLMRAQGTLLDDLEIRRSVKFLKEEASQNFEPSLVQLRTPGAEGLDAERDEMFDQAVDIVLETRRGSVSLLQRRLAIGYSRASRLIEQMAASGLLGEYKGSQAREVAITVDEWEAMKAQAEKDAAAGTVFEKYDEPQTEDDTFNPDAEDEDDSVPDEMDNEYRQ